MRGMLSIKTTSDTYTDTNAKATGLRSGIRHRWTVSSCVSGTEEEEEGVTAKVKKPKTKIWLWGIIYRHLLTNSIEYTLFRNNLNMFLFFPNHTYLQLERPCHL